MIPARFVGSFMLAVVVVTSMLIGGLAAFGAFKGDKRQQKVHPVDLLSKVDRVDLAEVLGEETGRRIPEQPDLDSVKPPDLPRRGRKGFVELEVSVDGDGTVSGVRVLSNTHDGVYEEEAKNVVRGRSYSPEIVDGEAVPTTRLEYIDYTVPPPPE